MLHTDSDLWKTAMDLVIDIYDAAKSLPSDERYGLAAQMKRAASSIPSNIAEGAGRETRREKRSFLLNARGSLCELATQIEICRRLNYLQKTQFHLLDAKSTRVGKLLTGTIRSLTPS
jgi:four helix bundle protein